MMTLSVESYLQTVPEKFADAFLKIRTTILDHLPEGYVEELSYGMLGYVVPLSIYPPGYLKKHTQPLPLMNLGYQKNHIALYHYGLYADEGLYDWFIQAYAADQYSHKLDMGKSCIRFKYMTEIPHGLLAELIQKLPVQTWIEIYDRITQG